MTTQPPVQEVVDDNLGVDGVREAGASCSRTAESSQRRSGLMFARRGKTAAHTVQATGLRLRPRQAMRHDASAGDQIAVIKYGLPLPAAGGLADL
jgi:hypothetical protein